MRAYGSTPVSLSPTTPHPKDGMHQRHATQRILHCVIFTARRQHPACNTSRLRPGRNYKADRPAAVSVAPHRQQHPPAPNPARQGRLTATNHGHRSGSSPAQRAQPDVGLFVSPQPTAGTHAPTHTDTRCVCALHKRCAQGRDKVCGQHVQWRGQHGQKDAQKRPACHSARVQLYSLALLVALGCSVKVAL